jgi:flagellar biosynthetic protein FliR
VTESWLAVLEPARWPLLALISARVIGLLLIAPVWSLRPVPVRVRGAAAVVFSAGLLPVAIRVTPVAGPEAPLLALATEFLLGLTIGLAAGIFLYGLSVAAEVVGLQMGLSLGAAFGGLTDMGAPGIGQIYQQFALGIFVVLGGPVLLISGLAESLILIPPGTAIDFASGARATVALAGDVFRVAVHVVGPVMVTLLVTNLALAVLNRAVPQLNTMMVAVPVTVAVGLVAIGATLPLAAGVVSHWARGTADTSVRVIRPFVPATPGGGN